MTTATKIKVEPKWSMAKMQEEVANMVAMQMMTSYGVVCRHGEELAKEFHAACLQNKVQQYKALNVKTPMDLVKAMSEKEANLFGSQIEIWGDDKDAHMNYTMCGMWNAMKKHPQMGQQQQEMMGQQFAMTMEQLAKELGFKGEVKMEGDTCSVHFTK
jgi:hypothetical protein